MALTGTITYPNGVKLSAVMSIPFYLYVLNTGPPFFASDLETVTLAVGSIFAYTFPSINDPDAGDKASVSNLELGSDFITGIYPTITIKPTKIPDHVGTFLVNIDLIDDNPTSPLSQ